MKFINKILVPTDFSDFSLAAMEYATSFSKIYDARITVFHVVENAPAFAFHSVDITSETVLCGAEEDREKELREFLANKLPKVKGIIPIVRRGNAAKEIVHFAEEEEFDVIIMATHGRTGFAHMLMGSIAESVVRYSSVPVMTVKPEEMQSGYVDEYDVEEQLHMNHYQ
ncbi:MAG: universal stress protein [Ignavibacteriae bacterium]|nr:universal stress protein [Ignavibacteriota bacterium]